MHNILDSQLEQLLSGSKESSSASIPIHYSIHHSMPQKDKIAASRHGLQEICDAIEYTNENWNENREIQRELTTVSLREVPFWPDDK